MNWISAERTTYLFEVANVPYSNNHAANPSTTRLCNSSFAPLRSMLIAVSQAYPPGVLHCV